MKRKLSVIVILLATISSMSVTADSSDTSKISQALSISDVNESYDRINIETLELLIKEDEKRKQFASNLNTQKRLKELAIKEEIEGSTELNQALYLEKQKFYINAIATIEFEKAKVNFEEIAKEIYDGNTEMFSIARKIKIAQIYIDKSKEGYQEKVEKVRKALKESEQPDRDFHKIAKEYTDAKYEKDQLYVGYYDKWIIRPKNEKQMPPILAAAFKLKNVGDISDAVEGDKAVQFVKIMADTPSRPQEFEVVKEDILKTEKTKLWSNKQTKILNSLMVSDEELMLNDELLKKQLEAELARRKK